MSDEQRLRALMRAGIPEAPEPGAELWERSRARYHRVRAQRRAAVAVATAAAVLAVVAAVPRLLPGPPQRSLVLQGGSAQDAGADAPPEGFAPRPEPGPSPVAQPTSTDASPSEALPADRPSPPAPDPISSPGPTPCSTEAPVDPAAFRYISDLDGNGEPEGIAIAGSGLQVARSDGVVTPLVDAGGPVTAVGLVNVDGNGFDNLWVRTPGPAGERVVMARLDDCALEFVRDVQGAPYVFDVGERDGALLGMGCVDADDDGELDLVGLSGRLDGPEYVVERTVVEVAGGRAFVSATDTVRVPAQDTEAVALLRSVTCGDSDVDDLGPG